MSDSAEFLDRAAKATIESLQTVNMPIYERFQFFLAMNELAEEV